MNLYVMRSIPKTFFALVVNVLKGLRIPGLKGLSLWDILVLVFEDVSNSNYTLYASAMAFNFFLALFPLFIFVFSLIPFIPIGNLSARVLQLMSAILPSTAVDLLKGTVVDLVEHKSVGLISISFVTILFSAVRGIVAMMNAFERLSATSNFQEEGSFSKYGRSIFLILILFVLVVVGVSVQVTVELLAVNFFAFWPITDMIDGVMLYGLNLAFQIIILLLGISLLFRFAPGRQFTRLSITVGSLFACVLMLAAFQVLAIFFSQFGQYNKVYGSLTAVIITMVWFYWTAMVLLLGYHLHLKVYLQLMDSRLGNR
jgi:membrane protein